MKDLRFGILALTVTSALGCSPQADPIGKGSAHFQIAYSTAPDVPGCSATSIGGLGSPEPPQLPTSVGEVTDFGDEVVDGSGEYTVNCTVTKGGSIDILMEGPNTSPNAPSTSGKASIEVQGSMSTSSGEGTASISVRTTESSATTNKPGHPCTLRAVRDSDGEPVISAGKTRFTFQCQQAVRALDQFGVCETRGTVAVRDCLKE